MDHDQRRSSVDHIRAQCPHPSLQGPPPLLIEGTQALLLDEVRCPVGFSDLQQMSQRLIHEVVGTQPVGRSDVKIGHIARGPGGIERATQEIAEQVVVAKPLPVLVERDHEEIQVFQPIQHRPPLDGVRNPLTYDRTAKRSRQPVEDRRRHEIVLDCRVELVPQFVH